MTPDKSHGDVTGKWGPNRIWPWVLLFSGLAVYLNTLPNPLIFDDTPWIVHNERIRDLGNLPEMLTATNRPLLEMSLALNYAIDGKIPVGYHVFNMAIHILAGLTLFGLMRRTLLLPYFGDRFRASAAWFAGVVALLWLVHPLNTQSVTYVIQRGESMMGLCYLFTLYGFVRSVTGGGRRWAAAAILACFLGVGLKEVIATAPLVVLLYDWTFIAESWRELWVKRWRLYVGLGLTWLPLALLIGGTITAEDSSAGFGLDEQMLSRWTYFLSQPQVIVEVYLRKALWPHPLILDYGWVPAVPEDTPGSEVSRLFITRVLWQTMLLCAVFFGSIFGVIKRRWWGLLGLSFFLILGPTSSVMPIADLAVEHRMYLPLICVVILVVAAGYAVLSRLSAKNGATLAVVAVLLAAIALGATTIRRNSEYRNRISIWDSVIVHRPHNARGWHNLASALQKAGRVSEALICFEQELVIQPDNDGAYFGIGGILLDTGDYGKALAYLQRAISLNPDDASYHAHLGKALMFSMRQEEAEASLRHAISLDDTYGRSYEYLGLLLLSQNDLEGAINAFRAGTENAPDQYSNYQNLAAALSDAGQPSEAVDVCTQVIEQTKLMDLSEETLAQFIQRRDQYRAEAEPLPAGP